MFKKQKEQHTFYDAYYCTLFKLAYAQTNNMHDAEDLCQEVFMTFFEKYDSIENKKGWLFGAMRITVYRYIKYKKKKRTYELDPHIDDMALRLVQNSESDSYDIKMLLVEAFYNENQQAKDIYELKSIYNWTYKKISEHLNISLRRVRYIHGKMSLKMLNFFKKKGIKEFEDLL